MTLRIGVGSFDRRIGFLIFCLLFLTDLCVIAVAGTDIPFHDQWDVEGAWLYPRLLNGTLVFTDLFTAHNEHHIVWTHLIDLALFKLDGQWDPLLQLIFCGLLRGFLGAFLFLSLTRDCPFGKKIGIALAVTLAFLPLAAWHNVVWGFESQVLFAIGWVLVSARLLTVSRPTLLQNVGGLMSGLAGMLAMAPATLLPFALLGTALLRFRDNPRFDWRNQWPIVGLLICAWSLTRSNAILATLTATSASEWSLAFARSLAWPHTAQPLAAVAMNLPFVVALVLRWRRTLPANTGDDFVACLGFWAGGLAAAIAWARGGAGELTEGIPSRYVDFLVLLPLTNIWFLMRFLAHVPQPQKRRIPAVACVWLIFLIVGWVGLTTESVSRIILPRSRDMMAPVRLTRAFQLRADPSVFAGQPRLLIPHPSLTVVLGVLRNPLMDGHLPPSLQPNRQMGLPSRFVRLILRRNEETKGALNDLGSPLVGQ